MMVAHVVAGAQGNLRRAVELARSMLGGATTSEAGIRLGPVVATSSLSDLVSDDLTVSERHLVCLIAMADALPVAAFTPDEQVHLGQSVTLEDGIARLVDPVLGHVVRHGATPQDQIAWSREVARRLEGLLDWAPIHVLMRIRGCEPVTDAERRDAATALSTGHAPDVVLELLDGLPDDPVTLLQRGTTWSQTGALDQARSALKGAAESDDPKIVAAAARELGVLLAIRFADPAAAVTAVEGLTERVTPGDLQDLEAELLKWRLMAGLPAPTSSLSGDNASVTASVIGAMVGSLGGPLDEAVRHVRTGQGALAAGAVGPPFAGDLLRLSGFLADVFAGRLDQASSTAKALRDHAAREADPALGMWEMATAELALHDGRLELGLQIATRAQRHLAWRDFTGLRPTTIALRAAIAARSGRMALALELGPQVEAHRADVKVDLHLARVEAERLRQSRNDAAAAQVLSSAGRRALGEAHAHLGLMAIDEAVMVRPNEADVALLLEHASASPLFKLLASRAEALLTSDPERLVGQVDDLEAMGLLGRAAHTAFVAARWFGATGASERGRRLQARGVLLASDSTRWACDERAEALTSREIDVARLAARRMRSREIAQTLGVSSRTVDNHLGRAFRKLGVTSRDELPAALGMAPE